MQDPDRKREFEQALDRARGPAWQRQHWIALSLLMAAFAGPLLFHDNEDPAVRRLVGMHFGYLLAASFLLWVRVALKEGRVRGRRRWYRRDSEPVSFFIMLALRNGIGFLAGLITGLAFTFQSV